MTHTESFPSPAGINTEWDDLSHPLFPVGSNAWSLLLLEAWRRGLTVEISANRRYTISSNDRTLNFRTNRLATKEAGIGANICNDKHETKKYFQKSGIPTPSGHLFRSPGNDRIKEQILDASQQMEYPLCLKAANWSKGKGVYPGISDHAQLSKFVDILIDDLKCQYVILEEHFPGEDFRFFVVGNSVSGVIQRIAANITGDGKSTIQELIQEKNNLRRRNPYLKNALIEFDDEIDFMIKKKGYSLSSIVPESELVLLREKSNASAGGDSIDVTDAVSAQAKQLAVDAIAAIPGICHGGVDMLLYKPFTEQETASVIEINQSAEMGLHLYPSYGSETYPPSQIIDHYFPGQSKNSETDHWYFNLVDTLGLINSGVAKSVKVNALPEVKNFSWVQVTYAGNVQGVGFRRWLAQEARHFSIYGDVRNTSSGTVVLRMTGRKKNIDAFLKKTKSSSSPATVTSTKTSKIAPFRVTPNIRVIRTQTKSTLNNRRMRFPSKFKDVLKKITTQKNRTV